MPRIVTEDADVAESAASPQASIGSPKFSSGSPTSHSATSDVNRDDLTLDPRRMKGAKLQSLKCLKSEGLSPRRPAPPFVLPSDLAGGFRPAKVKPKKEVEPWDPGSTGTLSMDEPGNFFFDKIWRCRTVNISPDQMSASWKSSPYGGFLVSEQVLRKKPHGRWFEVLIEEVDPNSLGDGLGLGLAPHPSEGGFLEADRAGFYDTSAMESFPICWLLGYDRRAKLCGAPRFLSTKEMLIPDWRPNQLQIGDRVGLLASHDGHLMMFVNDEPIYFVTHSGLPWEGHLHAVVDLDGCVKALRLLESNGTPPDKVMRYVSALREDEFVRQDAVARETERMAEEEREGKG